MGVKEVGYGVDDFNRPKVLSQSESLKQIVMNVLTCKPGNLPSLPEIGVDINKYVQYSVIEDLDIPGLQTLIQSQLATVLSGDEVGDVVVFTPELDGKKIIVISIPITPAGEEQTGENAIVAGFSLSEKKELLSSIEVQLGT